MTEGDSARINCRVSGRPPPDIQWFLNGQRLIQDDRHKVIVNEVGSHALLITKTILSDNGSIACVASNRSGEAAFQVCVYFIQFIVGNIQFNNWLQINPSARRYSRQSVDLGLKGSDF